MEWDRDLPVALCRACTNSAISAFRFKQICVASDFTWRSTVNKLVIKNEMLERNEKMYLCLDEKNENISEDLKKAEANFNFLEECTRTLTTKRVKGIKCPGLKCLDCGKKYPTTSFLDKHLRSSTKRVCNRCARIIPRDKLARHLRVVHDVEVYECDKCYKLFDEIPQLNRHTAEYHLFIECQCKVCGQGFKNERSLRAHEYAHTLFDCASCNKSFENRKCFLFHQLKCKQKTSTTSSYECHDCGAVYTKKPSLKMHIILKHLNVGKPYVCQECGKRFATQAHSRAHEVVHRERPVFSCHCGAKMRTLLGFKMHQRIHSGEKPYECEECGERFLSASRRLDHVKRRHWTSKEMTHKCTNCSATFLRPFELKKHCLKSHSS